MALDADLTYQILDVFTETRFEGNPLAVVQVPPHLKDKLDQATKQRIAKEFNFSETVFLHEKDDEEATELQMDIFTIDQELPFAGHPTIGTAALMRNEFSKPIDTLVTKAGPILLEDIHEKYLYVKAAIPQDVHIHQKTLGDVVGGGSLTGLSSVSAIREAELKAPVVSVVKGMTFVLVELSSLELLAQVQVGLNLDFEKLPSPVLDAEWSPSFTARYYYVRTGSEGGKQQIRSRMVELSFEDPATGSAASTLAGYLTLTEFKAGMKFEITQGVEMGRKSDISVETVASQAEEDEGKVKIQELWLGGTAVVVMKGFLSV